MAEVGKRLKAAREYLGYTQEEVAKLIGMGRNTIINLENGSRSLKIEEAESFCKLFGITMNDLTKTNYSENQETVLFARGFENLTVKDKQEILNLIKFKNQYKG